MKIVAWMLLVLLMAGCGKTQVYETVNDEPVFTTQPPAKEVRFNLAQETILPAMETDGGRLYMCGDYDIMVQTMDGGDLDRSVYQVSGFLPEELTLIQTEDGEIRKYEFVWTSATEQGQQIGRGTILDDGSYHYAISATVAAELISEYQEIWNGIFESFELT